MHRTRRAVPANVQHITDASSMLHARMDKPRLIRWRDDRPRHATEDRLVVSAPTYGEGGRLDITSQGFRLMGGALLLVLLWLLTSLSAWADDPALVRHELPAIPDRHGVAGPFVGVLDDQLLVAGGANFPESAPWDGGQKVWHSAVYRLQDPSSTWELVGELPAARGYGVSVTLPTGCLWIGGSDASRHYSDVWWVQSAGSVGIRFDAWQPFPEPLANMAGAVVGNWVVVVGGAHEPGEQRATARVWGLNLTSEDTTAWSQREWLELPSLPAAPRLLPNIASLDQTLFVFGGAALESTEQGIQRRYLADGWSLVAPAAGQVWPEWKRIASLPQPLVAAPGPALNVGKQHFVVLGGDDGSRVGFQPIAEHPGFPGDVYRYHRVTDTWTKIHTVSVPRVTTTVVPWKSGWVVPSGEIRPGVRTPTVEWWEWKSQQRPFGWINYGTLVVYLLVILLVGTGMAGVASNTDQFFRAGQSIPWWAASLSIFATMLSSITFMSIPAQGYSVGWNLFLGTIYIILTPIVVGWYLPFFRRLNITSAYEYLELRFNPSVRWLASFQFILFQLGRVAVVLLLPALALSTAAGIDIVFSIVVVGSLCLAYTLFGGMKSVIWTDAAQAVVLMLGALGSLGYLLWVIPGGMTRVVSTVHERGRFFESVPWSWDVTLATGWFIMLGSLFTNLFSYTASQDVVQRYVTTVDEKAAARAIWGNALLSPLAQALFFAIGSCLLAFYVQFPQRLDVGVSNDAVFPFFIVREMPVGFAGLIVAAIFAASQSTVSSSLNSLATAYAIDFHQRLVPNQTDDQQLRVARWTTLVAGLLGIGLAIYLAKSGVPRSLWETFLTVVGLFSGAISGLFVLGIFTRSTTGQGALVGGVASMSVVLVVYWTQATTFWLFSVIGVTTCVTVGWLASQWLGRRLADPSLTIYGPGQGLGATISDGSQGNGNNGSDGRLGSCLADSSESGGVG